MKAARYYGVNDVRIEDIEPPCPREGQVIVKVEWCGICGSDLKNYTTGSYGTPTAEKPDRLTGDYLPVTLGHELCGRIHCVAEGSHFTVGQPVVVDPHLYCGACSSCKADDTNLCTKAGFTGLSGGGGGGFSEYVAVNSWQCYPVPETVLNKACLVEPLAVTRHALRVSGANDLKESSALVVGGGPIGISMIHNLKAAGAKRILLSEPSHTRQDQARPYVDAVLDPKSADIATEAQSLTGGAGVDLVFDCAGYSPAMNVAMDALRPKGTYVMISAWEKPLVVPFVSWMSKEITLIPSLAYNDEDFEQVVDDFVKDRFAGVESMITRRIHLNDFVEKGLRELISNKDTHVKILVTPNCQGV